MCIRLLMPAALAFAVTLSGHDFAAAQSKEEYKPDAIATTLHQAELPGIPGEEMIVKHFAMPLGYTGAKHTHPGSVFVYVLEGVLTVETDAGTRSFGPGELYPEERESVMRGSNICATEDLEILVFQVGDVGVPMMVKAE